MTKKPPTPMLYPPSDRSDALFSPCGSRRHWLTRAWGHTPDTTRLWWVMLNPSRAGADRDDPTIRKCTAFAQRWGYGGFTVINLFTLIATSPSELRAHTCPEDAGRWDYCPVQDLVGAHLVDLWRGPRRPMVVAAWGAHGEHLEAGPMFVEEMVGCQRLKLRALHMTMRGQPGHPLYLPLDSILKTYASPAEDQP